MNGSISPPQPRSAATLLPSVCVKDVLVDTYVKRADHFDFSLQVIGRTRFIHAIENVPKYVCYKKVARYSVLAELHKDLGKELLPYLKAAGKSMPDFPAKTWFGCDRKLAEKRVLLFNKYFAELFDDYGTVLLYSPTLIDFFEPTKLDLRIIGDPGTDGREFMRALALLASGVEVLQCDSRKVCQLGFQNDTQTILNRLRGQAGTCWEAVFPFDAVHNMQLFRVDVENLYRKEGPEDPDAWLSLYHSPSTVCIVAFSLGRRKSFLRVKELLGNIKLLLLDERMAMPPFLVAGFGQELAKPEVGYDEVANYMMDLFGDSCPYRYMEISHVTGHNVMESVDALAEEVMKLEAGQ